MADEENEAPWVDRDGFVYQFVFEPKREYETLTRNGKRVLDFERDCAGFDKSCDGGSLNLGEIEPFHNSCVRLSLLRRVICSFQKHHRWSE